MAGCLVIQQAVATLSCPVKRSWQFQYWASRQRQYYKGRKQPELSAEQVAALEAVPGWYWAAYEVQPWDQRLRQVLDFVLQHGRLPRHTARSGHPFLPDEKELGLWASRQRDCYKGRRQPQLSTEQAAALETVPGWYWAAFEIQPWDQWHQQVAHFVRQHERLPRYYPSSQAPLLSGEKELGAWCNRQQQRVKGPRHIGAPLTPGQQAALQALPGILNTELCRRTSKDRRELASVPFMLHSLPAVLLSAATRLRQPQQRVVTSLQHGRGARQGNWPQRLSPRRGTTPQQLAASSGGQDSNHEEARGHQCGEDALTNSKAQQQPPKDPWEQARLQVIAFREQHGRLPRANADALGPLVPGERPLGLWCTTQQRRKAGSKGRPLTVQERASLASIPGWNWWPSKRERVSWEHRLQQLQEFVQQSGRLPRSTASSDHPFLPNEKQLGPWALTQRNRYKGHKQPQLSTEQVAALESVPGWYWAAYEQAAAAIEGAAPYRCSADT
ncbi:hypothetical protein N2152v2_002525 [Parachlorella kessleri]